MSIIFSILSILFSIFCFGIVIALIILVPLGIYAIPYSIWCGTLKGKKLMTNFEKQSFLKTVKNATILYKSWILKKEPKF